MFYLLTYLLTLHRSLAVLRDGIRSGSPQVPWKSESPRKSELDLEDVPDGGRDTMLEELGLVKNSSTRPRVRNLVPVVTYRILPKSGSPKVAPEIARL